MNLPGIKTPRWYERDMPLEFIGSIPVMVTSVISVMKLREEKVKVGDLWIWAAISVVWLAGAIVLKLIRASRKDQVEAEKRSPMDLLGPAQVLYELLKTGCDIKDPEAVRITILRVSEDKMLEQIIPYVGGSGGETGRKFLLNCGINGMAVRMKEPLHASRQNDDYDGFIRELMSQWSYTEEQAKDISHTKHAWMSVPIMGKKGPIGVVYVDSTNKDFFTPEVISLIISACTGIADYIKVRYPK